MTDKQFDENVFLKDKDLYVKIDNVTKIEIKKRIIELYFYNDEHPYIIEGNKDLIGDIKDLIIGKIKEEQELLVEANKLRIDETEDLFDTKYKVIRFRPWSWKI